MNVFELCKYELLLLICIKGFYQFVIFIFYFWQSSLKSIVKLIFEMQVPNPSFSSFYIKDYYIYFI